LDIVITTSETAFTQSAETVHDFVTNPENWTKTYPVSARINKLPELPLKVGNTWGDAHPDDGRTSGRHPAIATRPTLLQYHFTRPGQDITLFSRTMTVEARKEPPLPDRFFQFVNPAKIDAYHEAVARELAASGD
jgi:hypothetical protein